MITLTGTNLRIQLHFNSGESNPVLTLNTDELREIGAGLSNLEQGGTAPPPQTGYCGFSIYPDTGNANAPVLRVYRGSITIRSGNNTLHYKDSFGAEKLLIAAARKRGFLSHLPPTGPKPPKPLSHYASLWSLFTHASSEMSNWGKLMKTMFGTETPTVNNDEDDILTEDDLAYDDPPPPDPNAGVEPEDPRPTSGGSSGVGSHTPVSPGVTSLKNDTFKGHSPGANSYAPQDWDNDPINNCYNYGNNERTSQPARPGRGGGKELCQPYDPRVAGTGYSKNDILKAIKADGIPSGTRTNPCKGQVWKVAWIYRLHNVNDPKSGVDFHFIRMDKNGLWSHKPGQGDATNVDDNENLILDPKLAFETGGFAYYNRWGGYLCTNNNLANLA